MKSVCSSDLPSVLARLSFKGGGGEMYQFVFGPILDAAYTSLSKQSHCLGPSSETLLCLPSREHRHPAVRPP